jgi:hypothetical protein
MGLLESLEAQIMNKKSFQRLVHQALEAIRFSSEL